MKLDTTTVMETDRLFLRRFVADDVDNLMRIFSDPEAMTYYPSTKNRAETEAWIQWNLESYAEHGFGLWAVHLKENTAFVGQCGLILQRDVNGRDEVEIGYSFVKTYWNRGYATEAACACRDYGFQISDFRRWVCIVWSH